MVFFSLSHLFSDAFVYNVSCKRMWAEHFWVYGNKSISIHLFTVISDIFRITLSPTCASVISYAPGHIVSGFAPEKCKSYIHRPDKLS